MDAGLIKLYSTAELPRLKYISSLILGEMLGLQFEITHDKRRLGKHPVINYSDEKVPGAFNVSPSGLLSEQGIENHSPEVAKWNGLPVFFSSADDSDIPFDIFSAAFYLVSRYEEYLAGNRDEHGRYMASASLASRHGFLQMPVIDLWTRELALLLARKFRTLAFRRSEFSSMMTIDADQPFAYLGRSLLRTVGGMLLDIGRKDGHASERYRTLAKGDHDPFNVFDYILSELHKTATAARFFFPVGDNSKYDANPSWKSSDYRELISKVSGIFTSGIHPSYNAAEDESRLSSEIERLGRITGNGIHCSRFHYIRLFMPRSYNSLIASGIMEDYSMGYPEEPGFRAGIARPFLFYDVAEDALTSLRVYPFMAMDATFYQYKGMSPGDSLDMLRSLVDSTRKAGGVFSTIWHNTSLLDDEEGRKWRNVFEALLNYQKQ